MNAPRHWTREEIGAAAREARSLFRAERLDEPLDRWKRTHQRYVEGFRKLFAQIGRGTLDDIPAEQVVALFRTCIGDFPPRRRGDPPLSKEERKLRKERLSDAFRYLAGPPISAHDLEVLAEVESIAPSRLANDPAGALRVLQTVCQALDTTRIPWIAAGRTATDQELEAAIASSAALLTAQRVSTDRRNEGKAAQEGLVQASLLAMDFKRVATRDIETLQDGPDQNEFCGESTVGSRKADVVVRLKDKRLLLIECKVSNSGLNSVKRINNDAAIKARTWREEFGRRQVVPMAVLSGVFKVSNLEQAQDEGLALVWAHRLGDLTDFIKGTPSP